jgi:hypothetical protein
VIDRLDRIELPDGVELRGNEIVDHVRGATVQLNETAARFVTDLQRMSIADVTIAMVRNADVSTEVAEADAKRLCAELNSRLLVNIRRGGGSSSLAVRWVSLALKLLPLKSLPSLPYYRYPPLRGGVFGRTLIVFRTLAVRSLVMGCVSGGALGLLLIGSGLADLALPFAFLIAIALAIAAPVHELAHVLALRGAPCFLVARGFRMAVVHNAGRRALIAAAGPASGVVLALPALLLTLVVPEAAFLSIVFAGQLLGLTVFGKDGRNACGLT